MTNFLAQFSQFHFLRPDWFWVLIPLIIFWILKLKVVTTTQWHQVIPPHLANAMLGNNKNNKVKQKRTFVPFIWLLAVIALAGPTWDKIEKPVFQVKRASVIVLDMSMSMRATDIKPNRLSKARFKAIDLANAITDGEVALVAYAGDAFTISPLTPDTRNITALIPSLKPEIMPVQGSYPLLGLTKASELLQQAGYPTGDIYWITDGVDDEDLPDLTSFSEQTPYRVNIMTVGTADGAPIKMLDNSLLKDHLGSIVIPKLNNRVLMNFSNISNGVFVNSTATDADIRTLLAATVSRPREKQNQDDSETNEDNSLTGDDWQEFGPYIILLILPLVLTFFRKGATFLMMLILPFSFTPNKAIAADNGQAKVDKTAAITPHPSWTDYAFKTQDQVGAELFNQQQFDQALESFENTQWKGASAYKAGDYQTALDYFKQNNSATGLYNQGNALANLNKIDDAIKAYDESLKLNPNDEKVMANRALLEQIKQQQKQDGDQQNQDGQQDKDQEGGQEQDSQEQQDSEKDSDQESQQNSQQQESDKENANAEDSNSSDSQSDQQPEPTPSESQETPEQQKSGQELSKQETEEESQNASDAEETKDEQTEQEAQATQAQMSQEQIEDKEQQQKIEQLLRKVSDDPATLLRNKMILESKKRQQNARSPRGATKSW
ncbi:VWA domain-containing protein [Psychrosphaera aquimarina]|uniref:VWA domain-containing protein n=1 Tax=Psychrosphaera aquimarina TaxID=2044854 RepID=A0ABU3R477_9GAMM|nr:VWA domain-containing protein [Psychrosphaera aquimarina]MDU0114497.1 VWA domain-containing protein [Psychrosphaera aquimarina]